MAWNILIYDAIKQIEEKIQGWLFRVTLKQQHNFFYWI